MDAVIVRFLARKAKKLAAKWGGQCIVFIDEIDAVGMRRASLGSGFQPIEGGSIHDAHFYGRDGALTTTGDLVLETAAWREKLFAMREEHRPSPYPAIVVKAADSVRNFMIPGGMGGGGGLALNQLLVVMDGIDEPPLMKRVRTRQLQHLPGRDLHRPGADRQAQAAPEAAEAAQGRGLLHRGLQRPARAPGPGAHAPGPDGPPHLLPHAHVGGPARHLRPLPGQGRARGRPGHRRTRATSSPASPTATRRR